MTLLFSCRIERVHFFHFFVSFEAASAKWPELGSIEGHSLTHSLTHSHTEEKENMPQCCGCQDKAEEEINMKDMTGKWVDKDMKSCGTSMAEPCMCYTCFCWTFKGCPFSCSHAWTCGKNTIVGPCISVTFASKNEMKMSWLCCPATSLVRPDSIVAPTGPETEQMVP